MIAALGLSVAALAISFMCWGAARDAADLALHRVTVLQGQIERLERIVKASNV